ncbi:MAG: peptidoglycan-binding protein [Gammaproteobacteria bacterium]|nr:peptidoglycan-binding protein [Gammaproteobacteria bacterium]
MDANVDLLTDLAARQAVEGTLFRGSPHAGHVMALQHVLQELGFGAELNWERYGADGDYGGSTARAVRTFAERNGLDPAGDRVTSTLVQALLARHALLAPLRDIHACIQAGTVEETWHRGSDDEAAVINLQILLNELGYGEQLGWATFGADGNYGPATARAVRTYAYSEGFDVDGDRLGADVARRLVEKLSRFYGDHWQSAAASQETPEQTSPSGLTIEERVEWSRTRVYVSDGVETRRFTRHKLGLYTVGDQDPRSFVEANRGDLLEHGLTPSAVNVMLSVSDNEGCLDAVNTWDNAFLSFGMFQWTAGTGESRGELPALLKKLKDGHADAFDEHFGRFGLDMVNTGTRYGYFELDGERLDSPAAKRALRTPEWAFRFCLSGSDERMKRVQIAHAMSRLETFYSTSGSAVRGYLISELVTSEYGVALLLDNHVNRPAYVSRCLEQALMEAKLPNPARWSDADERKLIASYLRVREAYGRTPMTDAAKRALVTEAYLKRGVISDRRGSFQWS